MKQPDQQLITLSIAPSDEAIVKDMGVTYDKVGHPALSDTILIINSDKVTFGRLVTMLKKKTHDDVYLDYNPENMKRCLAKIIKLNRPAPVVQMFPDTLKQSA